MDNYAFTRHKIINRVNEIKSAISLCEKLFDMTVKDIHHKKAKKLSSTDTVITEENGLQFVFNSVGEFVDFGCDSCQYPNKHEILNELVDSAEAINNRAKL